MIVNLSMQERPEMFCYASSGLLTTQTFMALNHQDALEILTYFSNYSKAIELKINQKRTEVMYQFPPGSYNNG